MVAAASIDKTLDELRRRLEQEPDRVVATLRLLTDSEALPAQHDMRNTELARAVNADRLARRQETFRERSYTTAQMQHVLGGITRQAVHSRVASGSLLALELAGHAYFPDWQIGPDGLVAGLRDTLQALRRNGRSPLAADALMRTALPEADGRSPADLLAAGDLAAVLHYLRVADF